MATERPSESLSTYCGSSPIRPEQAVPPRTTDRVSKVLMWRKAQGMGVLAFEFVWLAPS